MIFPMRTVWKLDDDAATRMIEDEKLSISETARRLGVSRQAVHLAIQQGRVPAPVREVPVIEDDATASQPDPNGSASN